MVLIDASGYWNHTGIFLKRDHRYRFTVPAGQQWRDWFIRCGPEGYMKLWLKPFAPFLRARKTPTGKAQFFTLVGTIGENLDHAFLIGNGIEHTAAADGELVCFANDVPWAYFNNHDSIKLIVEPITH